MSIRWKNTLSRLPIAALALALGTGLVVACDSTLGLAEGDGRLTVLMTDAPFPFDLVSEANVTITRVDVVTETGVEVIMSSEAGETFNLLDLQNGVTTALGSTDMEAGSFHQVRLIVSEASILLIDGREFDLFIPSGAQTGIKVLIPNGSVENGSETQLTLDFDVSESFVVLGNPDTPAGINGFIFKPVVRPVGMTVNGEPADADEGEGEEG